MWTCSPNRTCLDGSEAAAGPDGATTGDRTGPDSDLAAASNGAGGGAAGDSVETVGVGAGGDGVEATGNGAGGGAAGWMDSVEPPTGTDG